MTRRPVLVVGASEDHDGIVIDEPAVTNPWRTPRGQLMTERVESRAIGTLNADDDAAVRGLNGWIALFWLMLFVACVTAPIDLGVSPRLVVMAVLVPVLAGAYHSLGVRAIRHETPRSLAAFLAVGVPAMCGLVLVHPVFHVLLFALYPVCFAASDSLRTGLIAAGVLSVGVTVADVSTHGWSSEAWVIAGLQTAIGLMFLWCWARTSRESSSSHAAGRI